MLPTDLISSSDQVSPQPKREAMEAIFSENVTDNNMLYNHAVFGGEYLSA